MRGMAEKETAGINLNIAICSMDRKNKKKTLIDFFGSEKNSKNFVYFPPNFFCISVNDSYLQLYVGHVWKSCLRNVEKPVDPKTG
jgi:hypothetical protein